MSDDAWGMTVTADGSCQLLSPVSIVLCGQAALGQESLYTLG